MQNVEKFLKKLNLRDRSRLENAILNIISGRLLGLNVKKLKGVENIFRVRIGKVRIVYEKIDGTCIIVEVGWRDDNTYRNY